MKDKHILWLGLPTILIVSLAMSFIFNWNADETIGYITGLLFGYIIRHYCGN